jgi:hypothetical protein
MFSFVVLLISLAQGSIPQDSAALKRLRVEIPPCRAWEFQSTRRNPSTTELRCRYGIDGPGRFGLLSYSDVPVYQPATPLPGTHVVAVPGLPRPAIGESYEAWEWRVLRTQYGPEANRVERSLEVLDPFFAARLLRLERRLAEEGVPAVRRETWRSPERQAYLFQQGRSRPGPFATTTLTSWHSMVDSTGRPTGRAADYNVSSRHMPRFHEVAAEVGLHSFGADSNDPGHVFLPETDEMPMDEIMLLRLLPRVPHVTLATGRPDGELVPRSRLAELRLESQEFAAGPFLAHPNGWLAGEGFVEVLWADAVALGPAASEPRDRSRRAGRSGLSR